MKTSPLLTQLLHQFKCKSPLICKAFVSMLSRWLPLILASAIMTAWHTLSLFFHLVALALWLGGIAFFLVVFGPAVHDLQPSPRHPDPEPGENFS